MTQPLSLAYIFRLLAAGFHGVAISVNIAALSRKSTSVSIVCPADARLRLVRSLCANDRLHEAAIVKLGYTHVIVMFAHSLSVTVLSYKFIVHSSRLSVVNPVKSVIVPIGVQAHNALLTSMIPLLSLNPYPVIPESIPKFRYLLVPFIRTS